MISKTKPKTAKTTTTPVRKKRVIKRLTPQTDPEEAGFIANGWAAAGQALPKLEIAHHSRKAVRHGTRLVTKLIERTGIPEGYSNTIAWFAERAILASFALITLSFAAGVMFVLRLSEPIAQSQAYDGLTQKARLAQQGIQVYSQQVIDIASPLFGDLLQQNRESVVDLEAVQLAERKAKLKAYLASKNSPLAEEDAAIEAFATSQNMKMMVAIMFVESTWGQHCYYYNCSGITGSKGLRRYESHAAWIKDFDGVLERRYKNLPPEDFLGLYVQPGSPSWLYGVKKTLAEFEELGIQ